jgi:hypothetical protein
MGLFYSSGGNMKSGEITRELLRKAIGEFREAGGVIKILPYCHKSETKNRIYYASDNTCQPTYSTDQIITFYMEEL